MSKVNLDDIDVNRDIIRALKDYKQGHLLSESHFRSKHVATREMLDHVNCDIDTAIKSSMVNELSSFITSKYYDKVKAEDITEGPHFPGKSYELELLVLPIEYFKHIVDYTIRQLDQTTIDKIKNQQQ